MNILNFLLKMMYAFISYYYNADHFSWNTLYNTMHTYLSLFWFVIKEQISAKLRISCRRRKRGKAAVQTRDTLFRLRYKFAWETHFSPTHAQDTPTQMNKKAIIKYNYFDIFFHFLCNTIIFSLKRNNKYNFHSLNIFSSYKEKI